jgi:hypothetical protein
MPDRERSDGECLRVETASRHPYVVHACSSTAAAVQNAETGAVPDTERTETERSDAAREMPVDATTPLKGVRQVAHAERKVRTTKGLRGKIEYESSRRATTRERCFWRTSTSGHGSF